MPLHRQPALRAEVSLPHTDTAARTNLAIPIGPSLDEDAVEEVVAAVRSALA